MDETSIAIGRADCNDATGFFAREISLFAMEISNMSQLNFEKDLENALNESILISQFKEIKSTTETSDRDSSPEKRCICSVTNWIRQ